VLTKYQVAEIETLKTKVKQYSDYDEIKRELEIMKVSSILGVKPRGLR
jgi:homeobox protein cut-like